MCSRTPRELGDGWVDNPHFGGVERREFPNPESFDRARLVEWALSTSSVATLAPAEREAALLRVGRLADEHPDLRGRERFTMPYVTVALRAHT